MKFLTKIKRLWAAPVAEAPEPTPPAGPQEPRDGPFSVARRGGEYVVVEGDRATAFRFRGEGARAQARTYAATLNSNARIRERHRLAAWE